MDTEKVVVVLLVISILFSAMAVVMIFAVNSGMSTPMIGGVNTKTTNIINNGPPTGGQIGLNIIKGGP